MPEELIGELRSGCDDGGCVPNHVGLFERDRVKIDHAPLGSFAE